MSLPPNNHDSNCHLPQTPCTTFSAARRPPLRSSSFPLGLPGLSAKDAAAVNVGNQLLEFSFKIIRLCIQYNCPVALENPHTSVLWQVPAIKRLLSHSCCTEVVLDYCQYGMPWRKRTRIAFWHVGAECAKLGLRCSPVSGRCSRTGCSHLELVGRDPVSNRHWTSIACPYPNALCQQLATVLISAVDRQRAEVIAQRFRV